MCTEVLFWSNKHRIIFVNTALPNLFLTCLPLVPSAFVPLSLTFFICEKFGCGPDQSEPLQRGGTRARVLFRLLAFASRICLLCDFLHSANRLNSCFERGTQNLAGCCFRSDLLLALLVTPHLPQLSPTPAQVTAGLVNSYLLHPSRNPAQCRQELSRQPLWSPGSLVLA